MGAGWSDGNEPDQVRPLMGASTEYRMRPGKVQGHLISGVISAAVLSTASGLAYAEDIKTEITRTAHADGSSAVSVANTPVWLDGTKFGLDLSLAAASAVTVQPNKPLPWAATDPSAAAAWAKMSLPTQASWLPWEQTTVDMRVDPTQDSTRVGTTFTRSWVVWDHVTASFNDSYALTRNLDQGGRWETGKSVSFDLKDMGTRVSVAANTSSSDHAWLPSATAEQKLLGPLSLTTTVANTGSEISKSITAGFRHTW